MEIKHSDPPVSQAAFRHDHFDNMRKIAFVFAAWHAW